MKCMNRKLSLVFTMLCACALAFILGGCEAIGIGNTGNGVPQVGQAKVSTPAISEEGVLRVGVDAANAPFSTLVDSKMVGIDVDIAAALGDELGVKVKVVDVGSNSEEALEKGMVDVVLGMDSANTAATCWLSDPYLSTAVAIFATAGGGILPTVESKPVIEAQESSMSAWEISNQFGEDALKTAPDLKTVFDDLENGKTAYAAADAIIGSYVTHTSGGKAQIIGLMQKAGGYCMGVAASNDALKPIIADAVKALRDSGVIGVVESKWVGQAIDFDSIALTEAASKATLLGSSASTETAKDADKAASSSAASSLGEVGGNAVALQDDGSQPGETGDTGTGVTEGYWGYTYDTTQADTTTYEYPETYNYEEQVTTPADEAPTDDDFVEYPNGPGDGGEGGEGGAGGEGGEGGI